MINLLVINEYDGIRTTRPHFFKMFDYLIENENFKTILMSEIANKTKQEITNILLEKFGELPNNIVFNEHLTEMDTIQIPDEIKITVLIDDLHHQGAIKTNRNIGLKKVSRILSTYAYAFHKYYHTDKPIYFFPHSGTFDLGFNDNPRDKILVSGRLHKDIYPFRQLLHNLSKTNSFLEYLPVNCNYQIKNDSSELIYGKRYVEKLRQYLACFTCDASEHRPYIVAKHFEIMLVGSLLLAGNPHTKGYFEKLGLIDNVHYISATVYNVQDKIDFIKDPKNRTTIDQIRKNGYLFVKSNHTYINRAIFLKQILENDTINNNNNNNGCIILENNGINGGCYYTKKY